MSNASTENFRPLPQDAAAMLADGNVFAAVRSVRASHGVGLKEAKDWVDWHVRENPVLRTKIEAQARVVRRKTFLWFLLVDAVIVAGIIYYVFNRGSN